MSRKVIAFAFVAAVVAAILIYNSETMKERRIINSLVAQNIAARGGAETWQALKSLRLAGQMDLGQGMHVPYVMDQKRPGKMCIEFVFEEKTAVQCVDGENGWKLLPFRGRNKPEAMTDQEFNAMAGAADIEGLLFNAAENGKTIELAGKDIVAGKSATRLKVTLPGGAVRWIYIDDETGLDLKLETTRVVRGQERLVETYYYDWQRTDGLLIPRRQETRTQGDDEFHFVTVDSVVRNPTLEDSRFSMPDIAGAGAS